MQAVQEIARHGVWPSRWKVGRVTALWKRNSKSDPKNYRPVTVLDNLSLAFERTVDSQLSGFLYKFVPQEQFGFKKGCGTDDYSVCLSTALHLAMEAGFESILVALDVAGAFDKVWWKALLHKLSQCGCSGLALKLLESYFRSSWLYVVVAGVASALKKYSAGFLQGGAWSPKFWNFYIQDLASCCKHATLFKYADDCTMKVSFQPSDRDAAISVLNEDLKRISRWGRRSKTTFEPTKTHAMLVSNSKRVP